MIELEGQASKMSTTRVDAEELAERFRHASGHATMPGDWTPVGAWIRVSGDKQDEENQVDEVIKYAIQHRYWIVRWYIVHAKSAFKGEHQADLDVAVEDMREGFTHVLVIAHSNRIERREGKIGTELLNTLAEFADAGGRVESVEEPMLGQLDMGSRILTYVTGLQNTEKSLTIRRETKRAYNRIDANHGVRNRVPWGYVYEGPKYDKHPVPTDICREYWPKVLDRCIKGDSATTIAAWLDAESVPTEKGGKWNQGTVLHLIHNPIYCGRRLGWGSDAPLLEDEAVVTVDIWVLANEALANRPKRGPVASTNRPMLAKLKCNRCGSPMYRKQIGGRLSRRYAYRCEGQGPQRKGCGNLVDYDDLEQIVHLWITLTSDQPYQTRQWVKGQNWDAEIADTLQQIKALNPLDEADEIRRPELMAELREYQRKNDDEATSGGWHEVDTGMTRGEHFHGLDLEGQRAYLAAHHDIRAERAGDGIRLVVDGEDLGVTRLEDRR
jgi:DNA invertase Pin-like site-specific DNA recombinase